MNSQPRIPDAATRAKSISRWREVCSQFDALNFLLDETIAQAELDIRQNPLLARRLEQAELARTKEALKESAS